MTNPIESILLLAFDGVGEQDLLAPWELLRAVAYARSQRGQRLDVVLGSLDGGTITTHSGLRIESQRRVAPSDRFDLIYIPGGVGAGALSTNPRALALVRDHYAERRWVAANCAGLGVLHRAGVLEGIEVTAPATLARRLPAEGTRVASPRRAWRIEPTHKIFTAAGAATVHSGTIALVARLFGEAEARALAADWDSLPYHGEELFSSEGPALLDRPEVAGKLQDAWENVFLPAA